MSNYGAGIVHSGVAPLAYLFSTCVECWKYIELARFYGRARDLLATQLELGKARFLIWGDAVRVLPLSTGRRDDILDQPHITPNVKRVLIAMILVVP